MSYLVRPPTISDERRALRLDDFCRNYGVGRTKAFSLIKSGELRSVLIGKRRLIPVDAAEALLKGGA